MKYVLKSQGEKQLFRMTDKLMRQFHQDTGWKHPNVKTPTDWAIQHVGKDGVLARLPAFRLDPPRDRSSAGALSAPGLNMVSFGSMTTGAYGGLDGRVSRKLPSGTNQAFRQAHEYGHILSSPYVDTDRSNQRRLIESYRQLPKEHRLGAYKYDSRLNATIGGSPNGYTGPYGKQSERMADAHAHEFQDWLMRHPEHHQLQRQLEEKTQRYAQSQSYRWRTNGWDEPHPSSQVRLPAEAPGLNPEQQQRYQQMQLNRLKAFHRWGDAESLYNSTNTRWWKGDPLPRSNDIFGVPPELREKLDRAIQKARAVQ